MAKKRLDILLVEKGLVPSRERAKTTIMSGIVYVENQKADKVGATYEETANIEVRGATLKYVSRGGLKLEKALNYFEILPNDHICMDIGASTGGFTDCLLQNGAKKVYSIDVGYGQLAWSIRTDERVVAMERTNIRKVTREEISDNPSLAVIDVSFISLKLVLPVARELMAEKAEILCLVKPQFEAGREKVGKKGVVREKETHKEVLYNFCENAKNAGFSVENITYSPIKGPEGNIEFLAHIKTIDTDFHLDTVEKVVEEAHCELMR
ncbi:MAG: TlyA family RNA methyltransferase [Clostridia bacterium]